MAVSERVVSNKECVSSSLDDRLKVPRGVAWSVNWSGGADAFRKVLVVRLEELATVSPFIMVVCFEYSD